MARRLPRWLCGVRQLTAALVIVTLGTACATPLQSEHGSPSNPAQATPESTETRDPAYFPFASSSPWNTAIGSGAQFADSSDATTLAFQMRDTEVNRERWTAGVSIADQNDPVALVQNPRTNAILDVARIQPKAVLPGGDDRWFSAIQPDRRSAWDFYGFTPAEGGFNSTWWAPIDLYGSGMGRGTRASHMALLGGLIRQADIDQGAIKHALVTAVDFTQLKHGYVWPADSEDSAGSARYSGEIPMGSLFAIPPDVDITKLGLGPEGTILARTLQDYGTYIGHAGGTVNLSMEPTSSPAFEAAIEEPWRILRNLLRMVTNNSAEAIAGGGTPRVPALPELSSDDRPNGPLAPMSEHKPGPVEGLVAGLSTTDAITMFWQTSPDTTSYDTRYRTSSSGAPRRGPTVSTPTSRVTGLGPPGSAFDVSVRARNSIGAGKWSDWLRVELAPPPTTLASDSFDRSDTDPGSLGGLDNAHGGILDGLEWSVTAQMAITEQDVGGPVSTSRRATVDLGTSNGYVEVEVAAVDGGVVGRYSDDRNYYQFRYLAKSDRLLLEKRVDGRTTTLWRSKTGAFVPGQGSTIGISCDGPTIAAYLDGKEVHKMTDLSLQSGTRWGIRSGTAGTPFRLANWIAQDVGA